MKTAIDTLVSIATANNLEVPLEAAVNLVLQPVLCRDCEQYVPLGWIDSTAAPKCPENVGASGVRYGHRVYTDALQSTIDSNVNRFVREASS